MLSRDRAEQILALGEAGWSVRAIADHLGHSPQTIRDYLRGRRTPGMRAPRQSLLTDPLANYCRQRFAQDRHLRRATLFDEVIELGFKGSRSTFYRELRLHPLPPPGDQAPAVDLDVSQVLAETPRPTSRTPVLPRPVGPITGETLASYLTRLAHGNRLTVAEVLAVLPPWFSTKINNGDDRAHHHMLAPATGDALVMLAHLTGRTATSLARALPAFGTAQARSPVRATTACHRCTARRGILEPVPVHLPAHQKICTRHGIWLSDASQPHLDLTACPEIIAAQRRANRLLQRHTPQQLMFTYDVVANLVPAWPATPTAIPSHWRHRLLRLQTANHRHGTPTEHDAYTDAAIYPDAIALAATALNLRRPIGPE